MQNVFCSSWKFEKNSPQISEFCSNLFSFHDGKQQLMLFYNLLGKQKVGCHKSHYNLQGKQTKMYKIKIISDVRINMSLTYL